MAESKRPPVAATDEKASDINEWWVYQSLDDIYDVLEGSTDLAGSPIYNVKVNISGEREQVLLAVYFKNLIETNRKLINKIGALLPVDNAFQKGRAVISDQEVKDLSRLIGRIAEVKLRAYKLKPFSSDKLTKRDKQPLLECFDGVIGFLASCSSSLSDALTYTDDIQKAKKLQEELKLLQKQYKDQATVLEGTTERLDVIDKTRWRVIAKNQELRKENHQLQFLLSQARDQEASNEGIFQAQETMIDELKAENDKLKAQLPREQKSGEKESRVKAIHSKLQGLQISSATRLVVGEGLGFGTIATGVALGLGLLASGPVGWFAAGIVIGIGAAICIWSAYEAWKDYRLAKEIENIPFRVGDTDSGTLAQSVGQMMRRMPDLKNKQPEQQPVPTPRVVNDAAPAVPPSVQNAAATSQKVGKKR